MGVLALLILTLAVLPRARTPRRWLTVTEAAAITRFSTRTIRARISDGTLPAYIPRGSRVLRIDADDLDAMMAAECRMGTRRAA